MLKFFKFILFLLLIPFLIVVTLFINPKKETEKNSKFFRWLLDGYTWFAMVLLKIKVHVKGMENVPENTRFLLVQNHYSNYDPIVTWFIFKKYDLAFVSKPENFKVPFFGKLISRCCFMAIDRENPRNAVKTVDKAAKLLKANEVSVAIYPEGTRNKSYVGLLPFHNSVYKIAQKANVPIVVVGISGAEKIHKNTPWKKTDVYLEVLQVLDTETVQSMRTNEIGEITSQKLLEFVEAHGHVRVETENASENNVENGMENPTKNAKNDADTEVSAAE